MKESVYIETSVISYLTARPSRDLIVAANQEITHDWWEFDRKRYDCYISPLVLDEISAGDAEAAAKRLSMIGDLQELAVSDEATEVARLLLVKTGLPQKVALDLAHIATAAVYGMDYLLTWNCTHIANPHWQPVLIKVLNDMGYNAPVLCTPLALYEGESL